MVYVNNLDEHRARMDKKYPATIKSNNPSGHNKFTPKTELIGVKQHPYRLMTKENLIIERKRLYNEKIYHQVFVLRYAQKISFIDEILGLNGDRKKAIDKAQQDFLEKEKN